MKVFNFPKNQRCQKEIKITTRPEQKFLYIQDKNERKQKFDEYRKKCASVDSNNYMERMKKQIEKAYFNSCEKQNKWKSNSVMKNITYPCCPKNNNQNKGNQKKLLLRNDQKKNYYFNEITVYMEIFAEKLKNTLKIKPQSIFNAEYQENVNWIRSMNEDKEPAHLLLNTLIDYLRKCQQKKHGGKHNGNYSCITKQDFDHAKRKEENQKLKLKNQVFSRQIYRLKTDNVALSKQIFMLKDTVRKLKNPPSRSVEIQTEQIQQSISQNAKTPIQAFRNPEEYFNQLSYKQKLLELEQKEKQIKIILTQLQSDGVDIEEVLRKGIKKAKQIFQSSNEDISQEEKQSESQPKFIALQNFYDQLNKKTDKKLKTLYDCNNTFIENDSVKQFFADSSITDDIDGLSFNYKDKEPEPELESYEPKIIFNQAKPLNEQMKKKLELNLHILYEEVSDSSKSFGIPTI